MVTLSFGIIALLVCHSAGQSFKHPAVLVSRSQLDITKSKQSSSEPWQSAYKAMMAHKYASLSYSAKPWKVVECGASSNPNYGCSDERENAGAAYTHALIYYWTGDEKHANKSIEIMDAWSGVITAHNNSNAPLQTGWSGAVWPRAGELIKHANITWTHRTRFEDMLKKVYLPEVRKGSPNTNGNWELVMIEAAAAIAVFLDDRDEFDHVVSMWRKRVPAYFYLKSDGSHPVPPPGGNKNTTDKIIEYWQKQSTFVDGLAQETCRDFEHTTWGIAAAINVAETAYHQGLDLYKEEEDRLVKSMEFHANYLMGAAVPDWLCGGKINLGTRPTWEIGYNHYHNRLNVSMPHTNDLILKKLRPTGAEYFTVFETLTHADNPNN